ncbi:MAG: hypothetical protein ACOX4U_00590 [Anaerovoracaceae bacterium]|jgi:hypothetical protein
MNKYYFTFGSSGQIYDGGWVEIHADSLREAQEKFIERYGEKAYKHPKCLNYSWDYTEEEFKRTIMYEDGKNYGVGCHEVIK